jgi:hypothetical protein
MKRVGLERPVSRMSSIPAHEITERAPKGERHLVLDPAIVAYMGDMILALKKSVAGFGNTHYTSPADTASAQNQT